MAVPVMVTWVPPPRATRLGLIEVSPKLPTAG
jgi:hypothetical protein